MEVDAKDEPVVHKRTASQAGLADDKSPRKGKAHQNEVKEESAALMPHLSHRDPVAHKFLTTSTLKDVLKDKPRRQLITLPHSMTVSEALKELSTAHVLSAPVVLSASAEDMESDTYMGVFDMAGLLDRIISDVNRAAAANPDAAVGPRTIEEVATSYTDKKLVTVCGEQDVDFVFKALVDTTVQDVVADAFFREKGPHGHVHRVFVFDGYGAISSVVSQTDVIRYLYHHIHQLGSLQNETVESLGWAKRKVVSVGGDQSLITALKVMNEHKVSAVAVLNAAGKITANLSVSDLKGLHLEHLVRLSDRVIDFLPKDRHVFTCKASDSFAHILKGLVTHKVHRVYVVDDHERPQSVVTLTDILRLIVTV